MAGKKKRDNMAFVIAVMAILAISSVLITVQLATSSGGGSSSGGFFGPKPDPLSVIANKEYAFAQAEDRCLFEAKQTKPFPAALFVDGRSTRDMGDGKYRVFIKIDPSIAMGTESFYLCHAEDRSGAIYVRKIKEMKAIGGDVDEEDAGLKGLLQALKNRG